jgi:hypothetical protein
MTEALEDPYLLQMEDCLRQGSEHISLFDEEAQEVITQCLKLDNNARVLLIRMSNWQKKWFLGPNLLKFFSDRTTYRAESLRDDGSRSKCAEAIRALRRINPKPFLVAVDKNTSFEQSWEACKSLDLKHIQNLCQNASMKHISGKTKKELLGELHNHFSKQKTIKSFFSKPGAAANPSATV